MPPGLFLIRPTPLSGGSSLSATFTSFPVKLRSLQMFLSMYISLVRSGGPCCISSLPLVLPRVQNPAPWFSSLSEITRDNVEIRQLLAGTFVWQSAQCLGLVPSSLPAVWKIIMKKKVNQCCEITPDKLSYHS